jgi:hypothetical protein
VPSSSTVGIAEIAEIAETAAARFRSVCSHNTIFFLNFHDPIDSQVHEAFQVLNDPYQRRVRARFMASAYINLALKSGI